MFQKGLIPLALIAFTGAASATQTAQQPAAQPAAQAPKAATAPTTVAVRDWSRVDTNRDHLVSPEEMEKYLADNPGPLKQKS